MASVNKYLVSRTIVTETKEQVYVTEHSYMDALAAAATRLRAGHEVVKVSPRVLKTAMKAVKVRN